MGEAPLQLLEVVKQTIITIINTIQFLFNQL